ncbi:MAG: GAF domain-containing protein [Cyanobacteria bacterium CRU_2_1]|nr:GAF domain-containing protein [Cyanobacteria bacterium RU_5_0]NJR60099.1 GAF domain-containing protein [Cyanobacteria bacterium CRU_2_1]
MENVTAAKSSSVSNVSNVSNPSNQNHLGMISSGDGTPIALKGNFDWQWLLATAAQIHQAETTDALFRVTLTAIRHRLQADRVLIYRFQTEDRGEVLAESLVDGYTPCIGEFLPAIAFGADKPQIYQQRVVSLSDVTTNPLSPYQHQIMERFQVKASLSLPILLGQIWGLLVVQQCARPRQWLESDVTLLYQLVNELKLSLQRLNFLTERQVLTQVSDRIRQMFDSATQVQTACQTAIQEVRRLLNVERVCIYKFRPNYFGDFIYESESGGFPSLVGSAWEDTYVMEHKGGRFHNNEPFVVDDVYTAGLSDCHVKALEHFGVKAFIVVAIKQGEKLWGLLSAFQHSGAWHWADSDVTLLTDVGRQLGTALQGADYLAQLQDQSTQMSKAAQVSYLTAEIIPKILRAQDLDTIFRVTNQSVRLLLKCDRVAIYQFNSDETSHWIAESATRGLTPLGDVDLSLIWHQMDQQETPNDLPRHRESLVVNNTYTVGHSSDEIELLEELGIKAYVMTPILKDGKLWGILAAIQNREVRSWIDIEVNALIQICTQVGAGMQRVDDLEQLQQQSEQLRKLAEREKLITKTVERIRQSLDLQQVFKTTAREIRNFLNVDRVAVYKFDLESNFNKGAIVAEDIRPGYVSILTSIVEDPCFGERHAALYRKGRIFAIADIQTANVPNCYVDMLAQFQVRGNLVVPLLRGEDLWGLFCIHQCSGARDWQDTEIDFAKHIASQLNTAIQQGEYLEQLQTASQQLAEAAQREKAAKERLQQEVIQVLTAVRPALEGDLTVRAPVTDDEVGTIADAYNNTLSSLRQIVMQMQDASRQVANTSQASEWAIASLTAQAKKQFQALAQAKAQVETMVHSTEAVGASAQQVETAVQQANQVVLTGDAAMDSTVDGILEIRETVAETNKRLKRLSESSQKISRVVNLISNFTTQTQLLALNAAIEATRAGDYGRGFAVVAEEVRSLARQSADAATEIEQLVQEIQMGTSEVSTALETSIQQVAEGTNLVTEARENLNAIVDATAQISQIVATITQATQEQTQQFQSVTQAMTDVATIANKTSEDSVTISTSLKELLEMAQSLQDKSDRFKVN